MARERPLSSVDAVVIVQVVLLEEPLGTLGTCEGSDGIIRGLVVMFNVVLFNGLRVILCVLKSHFKIKALFLYPYPQNSHSLHNLREIDLRRFGCLLYTVLKSLEMSPALFKLFNGQGWSGVYILPKN